MVSYEALVKQFQRFDSNSDGNISTGELKNVLQRLDSAWTDEAVTNLLRTFDANEDSKIQYEEFIFTLFKGNETAFEGEPLLKEFFTAELDEPHPKPSKKAEKAYNSIVSILQLLDAEDVVQVRAALLRDFRLSKHSEPVFRLSKHSEPVIHSCTPLVLEEGVARRLFKLGVDKAFIPDVEAYPEGFDPFKNSRQQIANGEMTNDDIKFQTGERVMALSGNNKTHWIWATATVRACWGKLKVKDYDCKPIYYVIEWADGYTGDLVLAEERLKKIDCGLKFHPGQAVEVEGRDGWIRCIIADDIRVSYDQHNEPKLYQIRFPSGKVELVYDKDGHPINTLLIKETNLRRGSSELQDAQSTAHARAGEGKWIAPTSPEAAYYGC